MRKFAAVVAMGLALAAPAFAENWTSPDTTMTFEVPSGWTAARQRVNGATYVLATSGENECHVIAFARPETADVTPDRVRVGGQQPIAQESLAAVPASLTSVFYNGDGQLTQNSVDDDAYWPVQLVDYTSNGRPVHGAIQFRPGAEFWAFCYARSGAEDTAGYTTILRSIAATNDAELQEQAELAERARRARLADQNQSLRQSLNEDMVQIDAVRAGGGGGTRGGN
jgi:hypothetical protein